MDRRQAIRLSLSALVTSPAKAQADGSPIWPDIPPGAPINYTSEMQPLLYTRRASRPNGSAIIVMPGGAYTSISMSQDCEPAAKEFTARGITVFMLRYRLPNQGWERRSDVPLQDAQRAIRLVRTAAPSLGLDLKRIGVMGFSAGGHVAASLATRSADKVYAPVDVADAIDARPDFCALIAPVITMGLGTHTGTRVSLLGHPSPPDMVKAYSVDEHVAPGTPPTFIAVAADDNTVNPEANSMAMYRALQAAKVQSELHVFPRGGHTFGFTKRPGWPGSEWPDLFMRWGTRLGFFPRA